MLVSKEAVAEKPIAMETDSALKLTEYSNTGSLMDDCNLSLVEFMNRFEKFKVDEISIGDAEDDICFNAKEHFDQSPTSQHTLHLGVNVSPNMSLS